MRRKVQGKKEGIIKEEEQKKRKYKKEYVEEWETNEKREKDKKVSKTKTRKIRGEIYNKRRNYKRGRREKEKCEKENTGI